MPFKPFAHLARVSFAKGITHTYAPSVVAAGQSLGQFQNHSVVKFTKTAQLQNAFTNASGSSGAGAKAGQTTQSSGGDAGLAQYYAAWQHAQQTGDDTEWKKHQTARNIRWKHPENDSSAKQSNRLDSTRALDLLRPSSRVQPIRSSSENAINELVLADESLEETEGLVRSSQPAARQAQDARQLEISTDEVIIDEDVGTPLPSTRAASPAVQQDASQGSDSFSSFQEHSSSTNATSPLVDESFALSDKIISLGQQQQYAEIPALFQAIVEDGLVPTVEAYNHILLSAIHLSNGYQPWPRALEIYGDMTRRAVELNNRTYGILLQFLASRSLEVQQVQKDLDQRALRYRSRNGPFAFSSTSHQQQLYADDISLAFATKLYKIARVTIPNFSLTGRTYNRLVKACARSGTLEQMNMLLSDMKTEGLSLDPQLYTTIIDVHASVQDISSAQSLYEEYRDLAISRAANDLLDMHVYAALIKAYYTCGLAETGLRFYEKVLQSFQGSTNEQLLSEHLTSTFVLNGLTQHHIANRDFATAVSALDNYALSTSLKDQALNMISSSAADANGVQEATNAFSAISGQGIEANTAMAVVSMHLRMGNVSDARKVWSKTSTLQITPTTDFAAMYSLALIREGLVEEAITEARSMFEKVRFATLSEIDRNIAVTEIDEAIILFGEALTRKHTVVSSLTSMAILRTMIENGGLVSPVAEHAIASLGPDCIHQLNAQDIALALHVQSQMIPAQPSKDMDIAHSARFCHLLETVLQRGILMDPSTVHVVSEALPRLGNYRQDLLAKWQELLNPVAKTSIVSQPMSPVTPQTPFVEATPLADTYDPYAHTTDFRASKIISEMLESNTGRLESHLSDALARLRNVRRAGRHLHYSTYAKVITAAGKVKQEAQVREILGMAQADVPFNAQIPAVRTGWISILDSTIAAFLTTGDRKLAGKYHQDLLDMGAAPSANTFGIYITTLEGTFDEATEAVRIFQRSLAEGVTPSVFLYNAVIGKLGKARRIDDCLRYFGDMQNQGIRPSSVTYGTLVNALCRTSEENFAVEMFDEMEAAPNYRPRPAPYNSMIQYFLNTKRDRTKVLQYYERMKSRNIKPTSHTYKLLIETHASLEPVGLDAAEAILVEMKKFGIQPEAVHYGSLIHAKGCVLHDMAGARAVFDTVITDGIIRPTDTLYQNLLESMVANHEVTKTQEILDDMKSRKVSMTPYIANTLIHGWAGEGNITQAKSIYDILGMAKREPSTYEAMTRAYLSVEDRASADMVVQEMLRKGYPAAVAEKVLTLVGATTP